MKAMIYEGFYPGGAAFGVGKILLARSLAARHGLFPAFTSTFKDFHMHLLSRLPLTFLRRFMDLPSFLFPDRFHVMNGHRFLIRDGERNHDVKNILRDYEATPEWEPETSRFIRARVKPGEIAVDIGASMGPIALELARAVGPLGKVYAFEPTERCFNYLCRNIQENGYENIIPFKMAAWSDYAVARVPMNDYLPIWANGVPVADFLARMGVTRVDFIKIDVDGPEPLVLKGLIPLFEKNPRLKMVIEFYPKYIRGAGCDPEEFRKIVDGYFRSETIHGDYGGECVNLYCERR